MAKAAKAKKPAAKKEDALLKAQGQSLLLTHASAHFVTERNTLQGLPKAPAATRKEVHRSKKAVRHLVVSVLFELDGGTLNVMLSPEDEEVQAGQEEHGQEEQEPQAGGVAEDAP